MFKFIDLQILRMATLKFNYCNQISLEKKRENTHGNVVYEIKILSPGYKFRFSYNYRIIISHSEFRLAVFVESAVI